MRGLCGFVLGFAGACNGVFDIEDTRPRPQDTIQLTPRTIVFDNSASAIDLVDFPVLVSIDASRIEYVGVVDPSTDLRFEQAGVDLPFEIDHWDPGGKSAVWVKVPRIAAGSRSDRILMHYGPDAGGTEDVEGVWSAYDLVLHCDDDFHASVGATLDEIGGGAAPVLGQVSGAIGLHGDAGEHVSYAYATPVPLLDKWSQYTFEIWLYADYARSTDTIGTEPRFIDTGGALTLGRLLQSGDPYRFREQLDTHYQGTDLYEQIEVPPQQWIQLVQTFDGSIQLLYRDAIVANDVKLDSPAATIAAFGGLALGGDSGAQSMRGMIDEVRISSKAHPPDWIEAQYRAMTGSFVSVYVPGQAPPP